MRARWALIAAVLVGVSYMALWRAPLAPEALVAWKGASVGLLAVFAALNARSLDGWLLTAVLGMCAAGDVLLETYGLTVGALAFLGGHLTAVWLYLRNPRGPLSAADMFARLAFPPLVIFAAWTLPFDRAGAPGVALYAAGLSAMAAAAWTSRFPRALTGLGALLFVASDLLLFARTGRPIAQAWWMGMAVWSLYFGGQTLIAIGVISSLPKPDRSRRTSRAGG
jgi:uncharacterized membrane protein YhhN